MTKFTASEIAKLPEHIRQQIEQSDDKPDRMSNKERAQQQYKPQQAKDIAGEYAIMWRNLRPEQRDARRLAATIRDTQYRYGEQFARNYAETTGDTVAPQALAAILAQMLTKLEALT